MALETPSRPPPFMANAILNFHFDFLTPSLTFPTVVEEGVIPYNFHKPLEPFELIKMIR